MKKSSFSLVIYKLGVQECLKGFSDICGRELNTLTQIFGLLHDSTEKGTRTVMSSNVIGHLD